MACLAENTGSHRRKEEEDSKKENEEEEEDRTLKKSRREERRTYLDNWCCQVGKKTVKKERESADNLSLLLSDGGV